jgi:nicotinamidase-related amidase
MGSGMATAERLTAAHGALLVIDLQEKLLARMSDREAVVAGAVLLVKGARLLGVPVSATEQYPQGLGPSVAEIAELIPDRPAKTTFHCGSVPQLLEQLHGCPTRHVTLVGVEAHVCVAQTALELLNQGFRVQVAADAVASRHRLDCKFALRRLEMSGAVISTVEAVLFEWAERSDRAEFKDLSALVKSRDAPRPFGFHS